MVLPVQGLGNPKDKKSKGKKKQKDSKGNEGVQVNLIVDPSMFGGLRGDTEDDDKEDTSTPRQAGPRRKRRGLFEGLAMEEQWKYARKELKRFLFLDLLFFLLWGVVFVVILLGKRCPTGQFEGW